MVTSAPWIRKAEWGVVLSSVAVLVFLHVVFFVETGALWRDEVNSVNLASLPAHEAWENLQFDSFPVLWPVLLRSWIASGLGSTDLGLRALGLLLGLGVVLALWRNSRAFGIELPLLSLLLLGFNASVLAYGDSVRGYGLGMITGLLTLGLAWEFVDDPRYRTLLPFALVAIASVHCVFYNAILLLAAGAGGALVTARRRNWPALAQLAGVGLLAALSLLLYREMGRKQKIWVAIVQWSVGPSAIVRKFTEAARETWSVAPWLWIAVILLALGWAVHLLRREERPEPRRDLVLFSSATLFTGILAYVLFLLKLQYVMQPWYFLSLMVLVASCANGILGRSTSSARIQLVRLAVVVLLMAFLFPGVLRAVRMRKTDLDAVAAALTRRASKEDLIVVFPWQDGITFARYYRGEAEWATVPPVALHDLHRYDLLKQAMMSPDAMQPLLDRIRKTLLAGQRVFWVGEVIAPPEGQPPPRLPPAPQGAWRWAESPHYRAWVLQAGDALRRYARSADPFPVVTKEPVSKLEDSKVNVFSGKGAQ